LRSSDQRCPLAAIALYGIGPSSSGSSSHSASPGKPSAGFSALVQNTFHTQARVAGLDQSGTDSFSDTRAMSAGWKLYPGGGPGFQPAIRLELFRL
jgi:hypothetical protein